MKRLADLSFSLNITVLKVIGIYPLDNYKLLHKVYAYVIYVVSMVPVSIFCLLHFTCASDLTDFKNNDFVMIAVIFYTIKFFPCLLNRNKIKQCIHYFDRFDYSLADHKKIIDECVSTCQRNSKIFFMGCVAAVTGLAGQTLMNLDELSLDIWLPKFVREKPLYFYTVQFLIVAAATYSGMSCGTIDSLMGGLCYHATAQIRVLKRNLQLLDQSVSVFEDKAAKSRRIFLEIKKCVRHHQAIQR